MADQDKVLPIALPLPPDTEEAAKRAIVEASKQINVSGWETYARVAEQVRQAWPAGHKTSEVLDEIRR